MGFRTGVKKGELEEGWNPSAKGGPKKEFHTPVEWLNMRLRAFDAPDDGFNQEEYDKNFPPLPGQSKQPRPSREGTTPMTKVESGKSSVSVLNNKWKGGAEARLKIEREATKKIRANLTANLNKRTGKAQEGVQKNSAMAKSLTGLLAKHPELVESDGLLSRIAGTIEGQGQHPITTKRPVMDTSKTPHVPLLDKDNKPVEEDDVNVEHVGNAIKRVTEAAERLSTGKGKDDDANVVMQFIGCFVDGLTEVTEGKPKAMRQFDAVWEQFAEAFGLNPKTDKDKLLNRIKGYKEIAGGAADTISGKGTRKGDTRGTNDDKQVRMPNDPRLKIDDENALIKNDISGSMHSSVMAQELAESLSPGGSIKGEGDSIVVKDKGLLDARVIDALALTAGGMLKNGTDLVMHTAFEMINGIQAITGLPPISQVLATEIMDRMDKGQSFTDAVEPFFDDEQLPWKN